MSFENLKKPELVKIAESFGTRSTGTKADIVEDLAAEGVTWELYQSLQKSAEPESAVETAPVVVPPADLEPTGNKVVVKFLGSGSIKTRHAKATAANPFVVVDEAVADALIAKNPIIWRISSSKELESFYA